MESPSVYGTLIWYYFICHRQVWLMSRQINPFEDNPLLEIGRFLHESTYRRERKSIRLENMELDLITSSEGEIVIGEVKKSSRFTESARMQLAFYLLRLREYGISAKGELLFPTEKKRIPVELDDEMRKKLEDVIQAIQNIIEYEKPPEPVRIKLCRNCAYFELCCV